MRRSLVLLMVLGLIFGSLATAEAGKKRAKKITRTDEADYIAPAYFYWAPSGDNIGGVKFATGPTDKFISLVIEDQAGQAVSASVGQDPEGDGTVDNSPFCTKTEEPQPIEPGLEVTVFVFVGPCTDPAPAPAMATQGTVVATFSNLP